MTWPRIDRPHCQLIAEGNRRPGLLLVFTQIRGSVATIWFTAMSARRLGIPDASECPRQDPLTLSISVSLPLSSLSSLPPILNTLPPLTFVFPLAILRLYLPPSVLANPAFPPPPAPDSESECFLAPPLDGRGAGGGVGRLEEPEVALSVSSPSRARRRLETGRGRGAESGSGMVHRGGVRS